MHINIFGASGSGVTTLGNALAEKLGYSYFDSDHYFWEKSDPPFTLRRDAEKRNSMINNDTAGLDN
jgi:adenylate kinase family enzyme